MTGFSLCSWGVPNPEEQGDAWVDRMRWSLAVMNGDDSSMAFVAGCLSYALKNDGYVTDRQSVGLSKVIRRLLDDFNNYQLDCQQDDTENDTGDLSSMNTFGSC